MALTTVDAERLTEPGWYPVGAHSLYLRIGPTGAKSWVARFRQGGKRTDRGLGAFHSTTLSTALELALVTVAQKASPARPPQPRRRASSPATRRPAKVTPNTPTLREAAEQVRDRDVRGGTITSEKHARNWLQVLDRHIMPTLGTRPVDTLTKRDVLTVLEPIWHTHPETAKRALARLMTIFSWAVARDFMEHVPVTPQVVKEGLGKTRRDVEHFAALPHSAAPDLYRALEASGGMPSVNRALRFVMLTAARSGEARGATWAEVDLDAATWTVPASRMKAGREHRVPLSIQVVRILRDALAVRRTPPDPTDLLFPNGVTQRRLSDKAMRDLLTRLCESCTVHGFRSTFKDWTMEKTDTPWAVAEAALAHALGDSTETAYARTDLIERRQGLMAAWANYVSPREEPLF